MCSYAELLCRQQATLIQCIEVLYGRLCNGEGVDDLAIRCIDGRPSVNDIIQCLGLMAPGDTDDDSELGIVSPKSDWSSFHSTPSVAANFPGTPRTESERCRETKFTRASQDHQDVNPLTESDSVASRVPSIVDANMWPGADDLPLQRPYKAGDVPWYTAPPHQSEAEEQTCSSFTTNEDPTLLNQPDAFAWVVSDLNVLPWMHMNQDEYPISSPENAMSNPRMPLYWGPQEVF